VLINQPGQHRLSQATTPERTVGIIGSVWQESTSLKETTGPPQTRKGKRYENEQSEMPNGARAAFA